MRRVVVDPSGCWLWTGATRHGYGCISDGPGEARSTKQTHRVVYENLVGPIPQDRELDHLCRVRRCCNPAHLELVTSRENTLRGTAPTAVNARKTHCGRGHEYTPANTYLSPKGRECRRCRQNAARIAYLRTRLPREEGKQQ